MNVPQPVGKVQQPVAQMKSPTSRWTKRPSPKQGPADLTDQERHDGAEWYLYKWLSVAELGAIPKLAPRQPEPGEI